MAFSFMNRTKPEGLSHNTGATGYTPIGPVANAVVQTTDTRRPCYVDGKRALFHAWANTARPAMPRGADPDTNPDYFQLSHLHAVVEYEDGTVARVWPQHVKFADGDFEKFAWAPPLEEDEADADNQD